MSTDPIPDVCFIEDLCKHLRMGKRTIQKRIAAGVFPIPELRGLDSRHRWSGAAVRRFIETGESGRRLLLKRSA